MFIIKKMFKNLFNIIICVFLLLLGFISLNAEGETTTEPEVTITLTYPDGSTEIVHSIEEAKAKQEEWKLLYEGETDEEGLIILPEWAEEGEIKIVETKIPEGYTAETTETIVELSEKEAEIINNKVEPTPTPTPTPTPQVTPTPTPETTPEPSPTPVFKATPTPEITPTPTTPTSTPTPQPTKTVPVPNTDDDSMNWLYVFFCSMIMVVISYQALRNEG